MVLFTDSLDTEIDEIARFAGDAARRFYVYSKEAEGDVDYVHMALPEFTFVPMRETRSPRYSCMFAGNGPEDVFVIKWPRLSNIMDRDIDLHQIVLKGRKLVIDAHPFLGKSDVFWSYFPYSFIDKSLMGYPHSYAFRDAKPGPGGQDPFDTRMLARKVAPATRTYLRTVFPEPFERIDVSLTPEEHAGYAALKEDLFAQELAPRSIVRGLKAYVDKTASMRAVPGERVNLLDLNRAWERYRAGIRRCVVSDAKVDIYLWGTLEQYRSRANAFFDELWSLQHA